MSLLELKNLVKVYGGKAVVNGLSLSVQPGEIIGLLGPNGAGKTTAFYMAVGLIRPDSGEVFLNGQNVTDLPMHKRALMGLGYLAQEPSIFRNLPVEENILCILEMQTKPSQTLEELLAELHLTPLRHKKASALSGGERRRLEITRALVTQPDGVRHRGVRGEEVAPVGERVGRDVDDAHHCGASPPDVVPDEHDRSVPAGRRRAERGIRGDCRGG